MLCRNLKTMVCGILLFSLGFVPCAGASVVSGLTGFKGTDHVYGPRLQAMTTVEPILAEAHPLTDPLGANVAVDQKEDQFRWQVFGVTGGKMVLTPTHLDSETAYTYGTWQGVFATSLSDPDRLTYRDAFPKNIDPIGSTFTLTAHDSALFGFHVNPNGKSRPRYAQRNASNPQPQTQKPLENNIEPLAFLESHNSLAVGVDHLSLTQKPNPSHAEDDLPVLQVNEAAIPEPASAILILLGSLCLLGRPRRHHAA